MTLYDVDGNRSWLGSHYSGGGQSKLIWDQETRVGLGSARTGKAQTGSTARSVKYPSSYGWTKMSLGAETVLDKGRYHWFPEYQGTNSRDHAVPH